MDLDAEDTRLRKKQTCCTTKSTEHLHRVSRVQAKKESSGSKFILSRFKHCSTLHCRRLGSDNVSGEEPVYIPHRICMNHFQAKITTENLKKHATVSLIVKNRAEANFYKMMCGVVGPLKLALLKYNGIDLEDYVKSQDGDHSYSFKLPN